MGDLTDGIDALAGWRRERCAPGVAWTAPDGTEVCLRVRTSWLSIARALDAVIDRVIVRLGGAPRVDREPIARLVTREGELGAIASAVVATPRPIHVAVAIAGTDVAGCVEGLGPSPVRGRVAELIHGLGLGFGEQRRRPFVYAPPRRWIGLRRHAATSWLHPMYPRVPARMTLFDARPFVGAASERLERLLFMEATGALRDGVPEPAEDLAIAAGMPARLRRIIGAHAMRCAASAADDRYLYAGHYEGPAEHASMFLETFASLEPLPIPR
jgi:hypothetical protein